MATFMRRTDENTDIDCKLVRDIIIESQRKQKEKQS